MKVCNITNLQKALMLFLLTFPIFDCFFFYNSITTAIRIIIILGLFIWMLMAVKESRKVVVPILIYFLCLGIYFIFHHFHALSFQSLVPGNFDYQIVKEFLYFVKLSMPVFLIPLLYFSKLNKKQYRILAISYVILISGSIVVSNLFCFSYGSYTDEPIKANLLAWFWKDSGYSYLDLASKGFFMYANQISTILILLVPLVFLLLKNQTNYKNMIVMALLLLSMIMLGTRVASIGGLALLVVCLLTYLVFVFWKKEKENNKLVSCTCVIIVFASILLPFSPSMNRKNVLDNITEEPLIEEAFASKTLLVMNGEGGTLDKEQYIKNHYKEKRIAEQFILEAYPYQYDIDFWYSILEKPVNLRIDYRYLEESIIQRVVTINQNPWDKWLGITNTRIQNIFNIERDFVLQYYAFGIIGCLLFFLPYIGIAFVLLKNWIQKLNFESTLGIGTLLLYFGCSYLSGNNMNHLSVIIPFLWIVSFYIRNDEKQEKIVEK